MSVSTDVLEFPENEDKRQAVVGVICSGYKNATLCYSKDSSSV